MKNALALLLAKPEEKKKDDDTHDSPGQVAKDAARALLDSIRDDDAAGVVEAFQLLNRSCSMMDDEDDDAADDMPVED